MKQTLLEIELDNKEFCLQNYLKKQDGFETDHYFEKKNKRGHILKRVTNLLRKWL